MDEIRKSIQKKMQEKIKEQRDEPIHINIMPSMEEKHGYVDQSQYSHVSNRPYDSPKTIQSFTFIPKLMLAMVVFVSVMLLHLVTDNGSTSSLSVHHLLKEDFPFATVYSWYEDKVHPIAVPFMGDTEIETGATWQNDTVIETFQMNGSGIVFRPETNKDLYALSDGIVIFAGKKRDTNQTIIIQHANKTKSIYGHLHTIDVPLYKRVKRNEKIGSFRNDLENVSYFLAIEKDGEYIDPLMYEFDGKHE